MEKKNLHHLYAYQFALLRGSFKLVGVILMQTDYSNELRAIVTDMQFLMSIHRKNNNSFRSFFF
jgi:hypothetical protein